MLALFNMAARVAIADADSSSLRDDLWRLLKERLPELLIYNLGGVLVTIFVASLLLSPLWLGAQITLELIDYTAAEPLLRAYESTGFWGGIAHLIGLVMVGLLLAAVVSVPSVVITQMTLLVHMELGWQKDDEKGGEKEEVEPEAEKKPKRAPRKRTVKAKQTTDKSDKKVAGDSDKPDADS
jgi:hypothetical protein